MERLLDCDGDHGVGRGGTREANPAMAAHPVLPWTLAPPAKKQNVFSLHFPNFCDYFVKKVVYEIRKCHQLHGDFDPLKFILHVERVTMSAREHNGQGDIGARGSLSFSKLCDNFFQKLVSEMRKCSQLQREIVPLTTSL